MCKEQAVVQPEEKKASEDAKEMAASQKHATIDTVKVDSSVILAPESPGKKISLSTDAFPLLEKLLAFLGRTEELNPVLAGYFNRVFGSVFEKKRPEIKAYLQLHPIHTENFIKHSYDISIADAISKLLNEYFGDSPDEKFTLCKRDIIKRIFEYNDHKLLESRWETINFLINSRTELPFILSKEILHIIFKVTCEKQENIKGGLKLLKNLITSNANESKSAQQENTEGPPSPERKEEGKLDYSILVQLAVEHMGFFISFLSTELKVLKIMLIIVGSNNRGRTQYNCATNCRMDFSPNKIQE